jgi:hypothetical protein
VVRLEQVSRATAAYFVTRYWRASALRRLYSFLSKEMQLRKPNTPGLASLGLRGTLGTLKPVSFGTDLDTASACEIAPVVLAVARGAMAPGGKGDSHQKTKPDLCNAASVQNGAAMFLDRCGKFVSNPYRREVGCAPKWLRT